MYAGHEAMVSSIRPKLNPPNDAFGSEKANTAASKQNSMLHVTSLQSTSTDTARIQYHHIKYVRLENQC
jgi:hypothetical protein